MDELDFYINYLEKYELDHFQITNRRYSSDYIGRTSHAQKDGLSIELRTKKSRKFYTLKVGKEPYYTFDDMPRKWFACYLNLGHSIRGRMASIENRLMGAYHDITNSDEFEKFINYCLDDMKEQSGRTLIFDRHGKQKNILEILKIFRGNFDKLIKFYYSPISYRVIEDNKFISHHKIEGEYRDFEIVKMINELEIRFYKDAENSEIKIIKGFIKDDTFFVVEDYDEFRVKPADSLQLVKYPNFSDMEKMIKSKWNK